MEERSPGPWPGRFEVGCGERLPEGPASLHRALGWAPAWGCWSSGCSFQAYFPWWLGLGLAPWLLIAEQPAARLLGVWWLVMTVLTPLYHPYARLWTPLHALGWLFMAGVISQFSPVPDTAPMNRGGWIPDRFLRRKRQVVVGTAAACAVSAAIQVGLSHPSSLPWSWVLRPPEPSVRRLAYEVIPRIIPRKGTTLSVYATRPLAFYLAQLGTYSIELLSTPAGSVQFGGPPNSWVLIERDMVEQAGYSWSNFLTWKYHASSLYTIDPVTLLDAHPDAAFSTEPRNDGLIYVWSPLIPELNTTPPPRRGPPEEVLPMTHEPPVSLWPDPAALGPVTDLYQLTMMAGYRAVGQGEPARDVRDVRAQAARAPRVPGLRRARAGARRPASARLLGRADRVAPALAGVCEHRPRVLRVARRAAFRGRRVGRCPRGQSSFRASP